MRKKFVSILLAICMMVPIMSNICVPVYAGNANHVEVSGIELTEATPYLINGSTAAASDLGNVATGYVQYDNTNNKLVLNNAVISGTGKGINVNGDIEINLIGTNTINSTGDRGVYSVGEVTFSGKDGKLEINSAGNGIEASSITTGGSSIKSLKVKSTEYGAINIYTSTGGNCTIDAADELYLEGQDGIDARGDVNLSSSGDITIKGLGTYGRSVRADNLTLTGRNIVINNTIEDSNNPAANDVTINATNDITCGDIYCKRVTLGAKNALNLNGDVYVGSAGNKIKAGVINGDKDIYAYAEDAACALEGTVSSDSKLKLKNVDLIIAAGTALNNKGMISYDSAYRKDGELTGNKPMKNIAATGVSFGKSDTEQEAFAVDAGTLVWEPVVESGVVTSATITMEDVYFDSTGEALNIADVPVNIIVKGGNNVIGSQSSAINSNDDVTISSYDDDNLALQSGDGKTTVVAKSLVVEKGQVRVFSEATDIRADYIHVKENARLDVISYGEPANSIESFLSDKKEGIKVEGDLTTDMNHAIVLNNSYITITATGHISGVVGASAKFSDVVRIAEGGTFEGQYQNIYMDESKYVHETEIYGNASVLESGSTPLGVVDLEGDTHVFKLKVTENGILTIGTDTEIDATRLTEDSFAEYLNNEGKIVLNGTLTLPEGADTWDNGSFIKNLGYDGSGMIKVGADKYYDTQGNQLYVVEDGLTLGYDDITDKDGYTWKQNADGSYTLTLNNAVIKGDIEIPSQVVANIVTAGDSKVEGVRIQEDKDGYNYKCNVTFSGTKKLTIDGSINGGVDKDIITFADGANVLVKDSISVGASGNVDGNIVVKGIGTVLEMDGGRIHSDNISVIEGATLNSNSTVNAYSKFTMDKLSRVNIVLDSEDFDGIMPIIVSKDLTSIVQFLPKGYSIGVFNEFDGDDGDSGQQLYTIYDEKDELAQAVQLKDQSISDEDEPNNDNNKPNNGNNKPGNGGNNSQGSQSGNDQNTTNINGDKVETGDYSNVGLFILIILLSIAGGAVAIKKGKEN